MTTYCTTSMNHNIKMKQDYVIYTQIYLSHVNLYEKINDEGIC